MNIGFNSNNSKLNNFLKEQEGKPVTAEIKAKALEIANQTKDSSKQTGIKNISSGELKDIENYLKIDIVDKHENNKTGKAIGSFSLGIDDIGTKSELKTVSYQEKFANYNKQKHWDASFLSNSISNQTELVSTSKEIGKQYNIPPAFLLASFALETDPADHDIMSKIREDDYQEDSDEEYPYDEYAESFSKEEMYGDEFPMRRDIIRGFPVNGFLVGGIDNESWLKGLPFKNGTDYVIREEINEKGQVVNAPNFKDGRTCVKAFMMVFGREASKYRDMAEKENWKNFDQDAPFVLARLAYNAGNNSKGFKKALDFYKNGEGKELPHVQPRTNVEKNLEHALKILDKLKDKPELK
jgi:hypothetical protein